MSRMAPRVQWHGRISLPEGMCFYTTALTPALSPKERECRTARRSVILIAHREPPRAVPGVPLGATRETRPLPRKNTSHPRSPPAWLRSAHSFSMTWYYVNDGEPAGPISDEQLLSKLQAGEVLPTTLVWRTGMAEWQPASAVAPAPVPAPALDPFPAAMPGPSLQAPAQASGTTPPVLPNFFCTLCGSIIPADQLVHISGRAVCAACKPLYVQQTREGLDAPLKVPVIGAAAISVAPAPGSDLAEPAIRLVAHLLDLVFVSVPVIVGYLFLFFVGVGMTAGTNSPEPPAALMVAMFGFMGLGLLWVFFYWTWFIGRSGATPGMRIMRIKMVRGDRTPVSYARALGRFVLFYVLNQCTMGLTNLSAFFDRERRTVVDMLFDTRVVRN
jgi:uncharacterized RDD family membrane protein YckC